MHANFVAAYKEASRREIGGDWEDVPNLTLVAVA
jgi:hypothetical protein